MISKSCEVNDAGDDSPPSGMEVRIVPVDSTQSTDGEDDDNNPIKYNGSH